MTPASTFDRLRSLLVLALLLAVVPRARADLKVLITKGVSDLRSCGSLTR